MSRLYADDPLRPKNGSKTTITLRGASKDLASSVSFMQLQTQYKWLRTFFNNNRLLLRADLGYTIVQNLDNLPTSKRFYAGGINSLRGFGEKDIGPGRYLILTSAEYQRRLVGNWYGALFFDTGNAMDHWNTKWEQGAGTGIIWQSPIGALRFYVARALSKEGQPWEVAFSFGAAL
jgi:translocation and assembly module TamA